MGVCFHSLSRLAAKLFAALLICTTTASAQADWTLRCSQLSLDERPVWVKLRANGTAITNKTDAGEGVPAYVAPDIESVGALNSCGLRLRSPSSTLDTMRVFLVAGSTMNARNVRVRATINAFPSVAPRGQYVIAVRARGTDANKHGIFVRINYALGTMQLVRKFSTSQALSETVLATTNVSLSVGAANQVEVIAAKDVITARVYSADGVTLLATLAATETTAGYRSGDVFIGGEVSYTGVQPSSNVDLTFANVSVVDLSRSVRFAGVNQPTLNFTLPQNSTQGRFAFHNRNPNTTQAADTRFQYLPMGPTSGPSLTDFRVRAMADLDQDGAGDVIYHNPATGLVRKLAFDLSASLNASNSSTRRVTSSILRVSTGWTLATAVDLTGDGDADIVWQNDTDNVVGLSVMRRSVSSSWQGLSYVPPPFRIVGSADFDLDGNFDLLWQDRNNGAVYIGKMNRTAYVSFPYLGFANPTQWRVAGTLDYNFDDVPDVLWQNTLTGEIGVWLLNSAGTAVAQWRSITVLSNPEWRAAN